MDVIFAGWIDDLEKIKDEVRAQRGKGSPSSSRVTRF